VTTVNTVSVFCEAVSSIFLGIALWIHVAKSVRRSAIEPYRSRLLLQVAIGNAAISSILVFIYTGFVIWNAYVHRNGPFLAQLPLALAGCALPFRACWNYATSTQRLVRRFSLTKCRDLNLAEDVRRLASLVDVPPPTIFDSPVLFAPLIAGRKTASAILAIPQYIRMLPEDEREAILLHELAHIRNKDVGFLTWAYAFSRDAWWCLLLVPTTALVILLARYPISQSDLVAVALYVLCVLQLWVLSAIVTRDRESLADKTAYLLTKDRNVIEAAARVSIVAITAVASSKKRIWRFSQKMEGLKAWLADKALFGTQRRPWRAALRVLSALHDSHPSLVERAPLEHVMGSEVIPQLSWAETLWMGIVLAATGMVVSLGAFALTAYILHSHSAEESFILCYGLLLWLSPLAATVIALTLVLPAWSSLGVTFPTVRYVKGFVFRSLGGFLVALMIVILVIAICWRSPEICVVAALVGVWCMVIYFGAVVYGTLMASFWNTLRYWQRRTVIDFRALMRLSAGWLTIFVGSAAASVGLLWPEYYAAAAILMGGALCGVVLSYYCLGGGSVSGNDHYLVLRFFSRHCLFEGPRVWPTGFIAYSVALASMTCLPMAVAGTVLWAFDLKHRLGGDPLFWVAGLLTFTVFCFVLSNRRSSIHLQSATMARLWALTSALKVADELGNEPAQAPMPPLNRLGTFLVNGCQGAANPWNLEMTFHAVNSATDSLETPGVKQAVLAWVHACENQTGFGLWPATNSRLSATYYALQVLKTSETPLKNAIGHTEWIKELQQGDGSFRGTWSSRPNFEDTFFAVRSLEMLGYRLEASEGERCASWTRRVPLAEGVKNGRADAVYHGLEILKSLHHLTPEDRSLAGEVAQRQVKNLALANPVQAAEIMMYTLHTFCLSNSATVYEKDTHQLIEKLGERVKDALEAECARLPYRQRNHSLAAQT
jgi:Zn-dependent protease with chaperone function